MEILRDLFDEKIVRIISLFIENPEKRFSLTEVANLSKVNITTTFRILQKPLLEKNFLKTNIVGKVRFYQLDYNDKTKQLMQLLKKDSDNPLQEFINSISSHPRIRKIILESKDSSSAKIIIIGDFIPTDKINRMIEQIKEKYNFRITYVEFSESQYLKLREFKDYNLDKKIIWERQKQQVGP
jgi:hypothetical protein